MLSASAMMHPVLAGLLALSVAANPWAGTDETMENLARRAEKAAKERQPAALGLLYGMWNMNRLLEKPERVERAIETILAAPNVDPLVSAHAAFISAGLKERHGKVEESKKIIAELGFVSHAMLLGPFENSAAQGHDEPFAPEVELNLDEPTPGKGHPIRWREVNAVADRGVFELSSILNPSAEGTAYILVALEANAPVQAALRTGSIDQLKVFFEGKELYAIDTRRGAAIDQDAIPISIPRGFSLLMIKSSWTANIGRALFRLTKPDGAKLDGVTVHGDKTTIARAIAEKRKPPAKPAHKVVAVSDALDRAIAKSKGAERANALSVRADLAAVLGLYDRRKLPTPPERDLEEAIKLAPQDPTMKFFYAHRVEERDPALAHEELERALAIDPGHVPSHYKLGESARSAGRLVEARDRFERALKADPNFVPALLASSELRFDSGADRELGLIDLSIAVEKVSSALMWAELARMRRSSDDRAGARVAAERALAIDASDIPTLALYSGTLVDAGELKKAIAVIDQAIALQPWILAHRLRKAQLLSALKDPAALKVLDEAAQLFPDSPDVPAAIAEIHLWNSDEKSAVAALDRALELDPFQPELRKHQNALAGKRSELEDEYTADVATLAKLPAGKDEQSFGAIYLADRTAIRLYENGLSSRFQQMVLRLRNPNLKDAVRVQHLAYAPSREVMEVLTAERVRPNGEVIKASSINDDGESGKVSGMYIDRRIKTIVFDDMAEGDIINIRYRTDSIGQNMFGSFFGDIQLFQDRLPKHNLLYVVAGPKSRALHYGMMRAEKPKIEELGNTTKLTWSLDQVPALDEEPFSPPYVDVGKLVNVSTYERWEDLGRWYAGLFADQMELDATARDAGKRAIAAANAKTDAEKIRALYAYVVKNTRYVGIELGIHGWKPFKASEVHRRRYGDCKDKATLLAALLRDNGIEATITLVRTADHGLIDPAPATMWDFNHAITYVPSMDLYLDGTAEFSGSNELPWQDQGAMVLVVHPDGKTKLATLPISAPNDNLNRSSYTATIDKDASLNLKGREEFFGARASQLRQEFEEVEQRRSRLEKQLNQVFNGVDVKELEFSDMSDFEKPVHYDYVAAISRYGIEEGGRYVIPLTLFQHQVASAYGSLAKRKYDLFNNHAWATNNVVKYQLPEGAKLESLPEGVNIDSKHVSLVQIVRPIAGGFETDDTVTLKSRRIPAADYDEFRRACLAIDRALGRSVVIRW